MVVLIRRRRMPSRRVVKVLRRLMSCLGSGGGRSGDG